MSAVTPSAPRILGLSPHDATLWMPAALQIYVAAMNYPAGTEAHRSPTWHEHMARPGYAAFGAVQALPAENGELIDHLVGIAYGYSGGGDQWWNRQLRIGLTRRGMAPPAIEQIAGSYFELTELHVHPTAQGHGVGTGLLAALLADRPEPRVLLSTPEVTAEANRAWRLYRRTGFIDVLRDFRFAGDPRPFAVLGRDLPFR